MTRLKNASFIFRGYRKRERFRGEIFILSPSFLIPLFPSRLQALGDPEFLPVDNEFLSVLGRDVSLPKEFKDNYEHWLEREVFGSAIDWDCLLLPVKY